MTISKETLHDASDQRALRDAFGRFATGVAIITARDADGPLGLTVNSLASASLAPPLLLFSVAKTCRSLERLVAAPSYGVNVLGREQEALSRRFSVQGTEKWTPDTASALGRHGAPLLSGALAVFECRPFARHEAGDHWIFIGEVLRFEASEDGAPLLFYRGRYGSLA
jgi:flavin reductase (DIM6/NTAB) family NADH-FMN oxidoreductase RutF